MVLRLIKVGTVTANKYKVLLENKIESTHSPVQWFSSVEGH